jgi:hypothetical protein
MGKRPFSGIPCLLLVFVISFVARLGKSPDIFEGNNGELTERRFPAGWRARLLALHLQGDNDG